MYNKLYNIITYIFKLALMTSSINQQQKERNENGTDYKMTTKIKPRKITVILIIKRISHYILLLTSQLFWDLMKLLVRKI